MNEMLQSPINVIEGFTCDELVGVGELFLMNHCANPLLPDPWVTCQGLGQKKKKNIKQLMSS